MRACRAFLAGEGIHRWAEVRPPDLRRFLAAEAEHRPAASSQSRTIAALKGFFRFLVERDDVWEREHAGKRKRERDRLLLALFAYAGLRRSELLGLDIDDIDLERRLLHVRRAKGGRARVVPIHPALEPLVVAYLETRAPVALGPLFVGIQGRRLSQTVMTQTFLRYARAAGVTERKRVTPHTLRHVFASELLRAGANLHQVQELLGHKHLDSTQRYTRVTGHELRGAIKRFPAAQARAPASVAGS